MILPRSMFGVSSVPADDDMIAVAIGEGADLGGDLMLVIVAVDKVRESHRGSPPAGKKRDQHRRLGEHVAERMRRPDLVRICRKPSAARRKAKGSREPVGFSRIEKKATKVSSLSAMLTATVTGGRHVVALPRRLVMVADRVGDGVALALGAGVDRRRSPLQLGEFADHSVTRSALAKRAAARRRRNRRGRCAR